MTKISKEMFDGEGFIIEAQNLTKIKFIPGKDLMNSKVEFYHKKTFDGQENKIIISAYLLGIEDED